VTIQQNSRKLLMMDILMSETCWAHMKWNKIASDIKLVFYSSTITMMHGPIYIRLKNNFSTCCWFAFVKEYIYIYIYIYIYNAEFLLPFRKWKPACVTVLFLLLILSEISCLRLISEIKISQIYYTEKANIQILILLFVQIVWNSFPN